MNPRPCGDTFEHPIDAIITWVDGRDHKHATKLRHYLSEQGILPPQEAIEPTRFNASGELVYCLQSIFRFAPWIRRVYIVTDDQIPVGLDLFKEQINSQKIQLIDHQIIFRDYLCCLPTFNSVSIEAMLWRIPDLSHHFIYFNDDCFLTRSVEPHDFFYADKMILRGQMKWQLNKPSFYRVIQKKTAQAVDFRWRYIHLEHAPYALRRDYFEQLFQKNPSRYIQNASFALRDNTQLWPIAWVYHEALRARKICWDKSLKPIMINPALHSLAKIKNKLNKVRNSKDIAFLCVQSLDMANGEILKEIEAFLVWYFS